MMSYCTGVYYIYTRKKAGLTQLRKTTRATAPLVALTLTGLCAGSALAMDYFVSSPVKSKAMTCDSCSMTRGYATGTVFSGTGMMLLTSIYAYHYVPDPTATKVVLQSFKILKGSVFAPFCILISGLVGLALASKINRENGLGSVEK